MEEVQSTIDHSFVLDLSGWKQIILPEW
jgi:hypothetical protein